MKVSDGIGMNNPGAHNLPPTRLVKAAHEFEAQLMKEILKPVTADEGFCVDENDSGSGGILKEFAGEALGLALSVHGGLGIAKSIVQSLPHPGNSSGFETVPDGERDLPFRTHQES